MAYGKPDPEPQFFDVVLTPAQHKFVMRAVRRSGYTTAEGTLRGKCLEALEMAMPTELPPVRVDWDELQREAERRGSTLAELVYDKRLK